MEFQLFGNSNGYFSTLQEEQNQARVGTGCKMLREAMLIETTLARRSSLQQLCFAAHLSRRFPAVGF